MRNALLSLSVSLALTLGASSAFAQEGTFARMQNGYAAATGVAPSSVQANPVLRLGVEFASGGLGAALGSGGGLLMGWTYCGAMSLEATGAGPSCRGSSPLNVMAPTGLLGAAGATVGVYGGGSGFGGRGALWATALGASLGLTTSAVLFHDDNANPRQLATALGVGSLLGALVGYEISHALTPSANGASVAPVASVSPQGAQVGLVGRF